MDGMNNFNQNQQVPPQPGAYSQPEVEPVMTMGDWLLTLLITCIPCVGIVMLFIWAFGSSAPKSKSNWAKAELIFVAIIFVLSMIFSAAITSMVASIYG